MGLSPIFRLRNPLTYPGGQIAPGFDQSHIAAPGCLFSAVCKASGLVNPLTGVPASTIGSPTTAVNGFIGVCLKCPSSARQAVALSGTTTASGTFAAILYS